MNFRRRRDESVNVAARPERGDPAPFDCDVVRDRQDPVGEILPEFPQPFGQMAGGLAIGALFQGDAMISPRVMTLR